MEFTTSTHSYLLRLPTAESGTIFDITQIQMEACIGRFDPFSCMHLQQIDEYLICEWIALEGNKNADKVSLCTIGIYIVNRFSELIQATNWDLQHVNVSLDSQWLLIFKTIRILAEAKIFSQRRILHSDTHFWFGFGKIKKFHSQHEQQFPIPCLNSTHHAVSSLHSAHFDWQRAKEMLFIVSSSPSNHKHNQNSRLTFSNFSKLISSAFECDNGTGRHTMPSYRC